ncbi:SDR family NAD(P)-dependent oxidoreductase [Aspergillus stella-maris]|uniref:SDR family NAD(P)-dependent oxidoreductase n=1 Tax=Aspergillus stella-maris TaxID=1810926 RepID=UPI003CCCD1B8
MTSFPPKIQRFPYEAIDPHRPQLSQKGRTVIVTGGSSGIGYAVSRAFAEASADRVIIVGRRPAAVTEAAASLSTELPWYQGKIDGRLCDIASLESIEHLWKSLEDEGITVDIVVLNAASFSVERPVLEIGVETLLEDYTVNVLASYRFAQLLSKQKPGSKKYLINVSTMAIYNPDAASTNLNYGASKNAAALLLQLLTRNVSTDEIQVLSYHPGAVLTQTAREHGYDENTLPWTDVNVPGQFAVWASSDEAKFLHGRFVHSNWDVTELQSGAVRGLIDEDPDFLKIGVKGLGSSTLSWEETT